LRGLFEEVEGLRPGRNVVGKYSSYLSWKVPDFMRVRNSNVRRRGMRR